MVGKIKTGDEFLDEIFEKVLADMPEELSSSVIRDDVFTDRVTLTIRAQFRAELVATKEVLTDMRPTLEDGVRYFVMQALKRTCVDIMQFGYKYLSAQKIMKQKPPGGPQRPPLEMFYPRRSKLPETGDPSVVLNQLALMHAVLFGEQGAFAGDERAQWIFETAAQQMFEGLHAAACGYPMYMNVPQIFQAHAEYERKRREDGGGL